MNKYKGSSPLSSEGAPVADYVGSLDLTKGLVRNVSPREIDLGATPLIENVRFERTGIRKDFGDRALGSAAPSRVLCIVEHKFIDANGDKYSRLIRLMRHTDGRARTEIWNVDTEAWQLDALTVTQTIDDAFVRAISVRGVLLFACFGSPILQREETTLWLDEYDDFTAGNSLDAAGEEISVAVAPTDVVQSDEYTVYYDVDLTLSSGGWDLIVTVGLYVDGEFIASEEYTQAIVGSSSYDNNTFVFQNEGLAEGGNVTLKVEDVQVSGTTPRTTPITDQGSATPRYQATKSLAAEAYNDIYTLSFTLSVESGDGTPGYGIWIGFYYDSGSGWIKAGEEFYPEDFYGEVEYQFFLDGMGSGTKFGFHVESMIGVEGGLVENGEQVAWEESTAVYSFSVHGHNVPIDADTNHGVEYKVDGGQTVILAPISGAPNASWIESFGDRIIALQDGGDTQKFSASADGTHDNWTTLDSVETLLVDTRNDPVDDLMCAGPLAANILAVIRSRSIMKAFETGNYDLAVGVTHWLEGVGTESPHSISITPAGLVFLGHDYMVYLLSESGILPIGQAISQELIETLTSNLDRVDGIYDPIYQEYWLGIPEDGAEYMTATYILDVGKFISSRGEIVRWRKRVQNVQRYSVISSEV